VLVLKNSVAVEVMSSHFHFSIIVEPAAETTDLLQVALLQVLLLPKNRTHTTNLQATEA
jgi:hypothetical protein